jgi:hypothetical protein
MDVQRPHSSANFQCFCLALDLSSATYNRPTMSFTQHLQLLLDPASTLPLHLDLGYNSYSWENGKFKTTIYSKQPGFRRLTLDELLQLMRRLHAAPHAVLLNLHGHFFGDGVMQEMAAPMAALSNLQALVLSRACPPPPLYCILHAHVSITTAAATATPSLASCVVDFRMWI